MVTGWGGGSSGLSLKKGALFSCWPGAAHGHGLDRLRAEGVQLLSAKELFYDWARALADVRALVLAYPELETPPGFSL